ncbi:MAG: hypothetical protein JSR81_16070 [Proteobacteria bacterium]|nr:hypothetical protein [Pseudomonadota bacterium]
MVEDNEHPQSVSGTSAPSDASAAGVAMNSASRERADEYLAEQARLARLQSQNLIDQNAFELSHLRFRRFSDYARFALEVAAFLIVLLIVCGLGAMVWGAARDHDLVVDAFSVPTDVARSGITGAVLAGRVMDRFGRLQADTFSITESAGTYRTNAVEDARVEIPDTGISIGELNRYLRQWLGQETHVAGDLVHTPKGMALTIRLGHEPGTTIEGADFDALVGRAAEYLYSAALPLRYADYLAMRGRFPEAQAVIVPRASNGSARARGLAFISWAQLRYRQGNTYDQMNKALIATQLDPSNAAAWYELDGGAYNTEHREMAVRSEETVLSLIRSGKSADLDADNATALVITLSTDLATDKGDPQGAMAECQKPGATISGLDCGITYRIGYALDDHDIAEARRLLALLPVRNRNGSLNADHLDAGARIATAEENWLAEIELSRKAEEAYRSAPQPGVACSHPTLAGQGRCNGTQR